MASCALPPKPKNNLDTQAINNFCEYLKIPSVQPDINYDDCVEFLEKQAISLDLPIKVHYLVPKKPIVILTWIGTESALKSVLLNSHMDVVPVYEDKWTYRPFSAHIEDHKIYGRGTQDMKSVGIQYLEAVKRLKQRGIKLKRTIHISFVPDEEIGGTDGMKKFVHTEAFQDLNVGVGFDESVASPTEEFILYYGERCLWQFHIHCPGNPGHGSLLLDNTAGEKVAYFLDKIYEFRREQVQKSKGASSSDVTSVNLTQIRGGVQTNVIPPEFILSFDCRIPPTSDFQKFENTLKKWCEDAGRGVWIEYDHKQDPVASTKLDGSNIFWAAFKEAADEIELWNMAPFVNDGALYKKGLKLRSLICGGATDARYVRSLGIPALGFSPMNNTQTLLHNHNEYLGIDTFLKGIEIYCNILISVGNKTE